MDQPVGISILGGLLIVAAAGCAAALAARLILSVPLLRTLGDAVLGTAGAYLVIFTLPMIGIVPGTLIGWSPATIFGAALPVVVGHMVVKV